MKFLILGIFFLGSISASELKLQFRSNTINYNLNSTFKSSKIEGHLIDLSMNKKKCNKQLVSSFHEEMLKSLKKIETSRSNYFLVNINSNEFKISKTTKLGRFLHSLPSKYKVLKKKEAFFCNK